jgi:acylphosphatase
MQASHTGNNMTTERIIFSGEVQGVGFRYTVRLLARRHPVQGFVRNLPDGTVELVVQGSPAAINALLADVQEHFRNNIRHCERQTTTPPETFDGFEIRF